MSRYIDADALLEKAEQEQRFYGEEYDAMESGYLDEERALVEEAYRTMTDCVALINNAPTVDAVPIDFLKRLAEGKRGYYSDFVIEAVEAYKRRTDGERKDGAE